MILPAGTQLGPYEISALLGAGGMGEVFRAKDGKLGRDVALKILPAPFAEDPDRVARFRREAQMLASLNHPHVAAIYGLEESTGRIALVLELVLGQTLDERLQRGALPVDEALSVARQIAEGLEAAHERGVIHRDLKPANVKITPEGTVKLLDFGLAKAMEGDAASSVDASRSPTLSHRMTEAGLILGTAAYMSPEQARGKPVDKRTDVWAFGVVLFEMLSGRRLFPGETVSDILAAVLTREPDWAALPAATPASVRALLQRCLQRDVRERLRDIGEARIALARPLAPPSPEARDGRRMRELSLRPLAFPALAGLLVLAMALLAWALTRSAPETRDAPLLALGIDAGGDTPLAGFGWVGMHWVGPTAVLSPDGRLLVFIARGPSGGPWQLYTRRLDELKALPLAGTNGATSPFFSPDGRSVAFFAGGRLSTIALAGGALTTVCAAEEPRGGAWSEDGSIVFAPRPEGPLFRVPAAGGTPEATSTLDVAAGETSHRWPQILPGGQAMIFSTGREVRAGEANAPRGGTIAAQENPRGPHRVVQNGGFFGRYSPSGHLLYVHEGRLYAAAFDRRKLAIEGRPVAVVDDLANAPMNGGAQVSLADTGILAYRRSRSPRRSLAWMDLAGQMQPMRNAPGEFLELRISPDGRRLVLVIAEGAQSDVWVYDIATDAMSRLTFHPDNDWTPLWSPDGRHVVYSSWRADVGTFNLFLHRTDGRGEPQRLTESRNRQFAVDFHPSSRQVVFNESRPGTGADLMVLPLEPTAAGPWRVGKPEPFLAGAATELSGEFSPDGKWLAYTSDESGRSEVYVQPFPGPGGRWQVSAEGAEWVEWRPDALYYGRSEEVVMRIAYRVEGGTFRAEKPRMWMRIPPGVSWVDPSPDGSRAAVIRSEDARRESLVLLVNFFEHLRRAAPRAP